MTATSELHELAAKKGVNIDFKFLEPFNFEFKAAMRMWSKKEMLGNYRSVQRNRQRLDLILSTCNQGSAERGRV